MEKYPVYKFNYSDTEYQVITEENCNSLANYMKTNNLKRLIIIYNEDGPGWNSTEMPSLKEFDFIEELLVYWTHIDNIEEVHHCVNLKTLWLDNGDKTAIRFESFPYLEKFVSWNRKKIERIWDVPTLKELTLAGLRPTMFKKGEAISNLKKISIIKSSVIDLSFIEEGANLEYLRLDGMSKLEDLNFLKRLKNVKYIRLSVNKVVDFSFLMSLTELEKCYIEAKVGVLKVEYFKQLDNLKDIRLIGNKNNVLVSSEVLTLIKNG